MFSLVRGLPSTTSASRPSASLVRLLRWYYAPVRLLTDVHARIVLLASRADPVGWLAPGCQRGLPVLARAVFRRAHGSWTTPGLRGTRVCVPRSVAFPFGAHGRRPVWVFRSSIPGPSVPLSMLHPAPHGTQRKTRGQDGSLLLSCGALSSPTARRFIPAIALHDRRGSVTFVRGWIESAMPGQDVGNTGAFFFENEREFTTCVASIRSAPRLAALPVPTTNRPGTR